MPTKTKISKMGAVRQALSELGKGALPSAIQDFVKRNFQLAMTTGHISNYKSTILREKPGKQAAKTTALKPAANSEPAKTASVAPQASASGRGRAAGVKLQEIVEIKALVSRVGAADLKALIDLVSN
jgi:hypothetical protein